MASDDKLLHDFLAHMGVQAEIKRDADNQALIVIETSEYYRRRGWIESWFTLVDQDDRYSFFHQRSRGTGTTMN